MTNWYWESLRKVKKAVLPEVQFVYHIICYEMQKHIDKGYTGSFTIEYTPTIDMHLDNDYFEEGEEKIATKTLRMKLREDTRIKDIVRTTSEGFSIVLKKVGNE